jgi:hypothetical protein
MIPRFVIADTTPVSLLSLLGCDGLDLLCATEAELVITDVVRDELLEPPEPGADAARERRSEIAAWLAAREAQGDIQEMSTSAGRLYRTAMAGWRAMGSDPATRPSRRDLGEASIVSLLSELTRQAGPDRKVFVIMDDRAGRAAVRALDVEHRSDGYGRLSQGIGREVWHRPGRHGMAVDCRGLARAYRSGY